MSKPTIRRGAALGAAMALVTTMTAACGGDDESSAGQAALGQDDVLTITTFSDFGYDKLIEEWNADPDRPFSVKMTKIADWDPWKQSLTQKLQAGQGLTDVVAIEGDAMPQFLADGASDQFADISDLGVNFYHGEVPAALPYDSRPGELLNSRIEHSPRPRESPYPGGGFVFPRTGRPTTDRDWEIDPDAFRRLLVLLHEEYDAPPIYITENGAMADDVVDDGAVHDDGRRDFIEQHLHAMLDARGRAWR